MEIVYDRFVKDTDNQQNCDYEGFEEIVKIFGNCIKSKNMVIVFDKNTILIYHKKGKKV